MGCKKLALCFTLFPNEVRHILHELWSSFRHNSHHASSMPFLTHTVRVNSCQRHSPNSEKNSRKKNISSTLARFFLFSQSGNRIKLSSSLGWNVSRQQPNRNRYSKRNDEKMKLKNNRPIKSKRCGKLRYSHNQEYS